MAPSESSNNSLVSPSWGRTQTGGRRTSLILAPVAQRRCWPYLTWSWDLGTAPPDFRTVPPSPTEAPCSALLQKWNIRAQLGQIHSSISSLHPAPPKQKAVTLSESFFPSPTILPQGQVSEGQARLKGSKLWFHLCHENDVGSISQVCCVLISWD